jgi:hypothetical protein
MDLEAILHKGLPRMTNGIKMVLQGFLSLTAPENTLLRFDIKSLHINHRTEIAGLDPLVTNNLLFLSLPWLSLFISNQLINHF